MRQEVLDMVQFHWWEYDDARYLQMLQSAQALTQSASGTSPILKSVSLTNFDTIRLREIVEEGGVDVVSNQVSFSLVDERPAARGMCEYCMRSGIKLLCYGTLLGGLLSDKWLGKPDPALSPAVLDTASLKKYYRFVQHWGGGGGSNSRGAAWALFQELLRVCRAVADKKTREALGTAVVVGPDGFSTAVAAGMGSAITISDVAMRWVLQQPGVGGVIVGARLGHTMMSHVEENERVFSFELDEQDLAALKAVQSRGHLLSGDCGDEYRG